MALLRAAPAVARVERGVVRLAADGGGVEKDISAEQHHAARRFGIPLVPADADADLAPRRLPDFVAAVAGAEIEFLLIAGTVGDMCLAVGAHDRAIGPDGDNAVVI